MGDINAYNPSWNLHFHNKKKARPLENLIDGYKLIVNNNPDYAIYLSSQDTIFIID